jgi:hypothetical protein
MRTYICCNSKWYWTHPWKFVYDCYREVKAFIHRGLYGWAICDTWSVGDYLNYVIPEMIKILNENTHGCPSVFTNDENGKEFQSIEEGCKDWSEILLMIEESFKLRNFMDNDYFYQVDWEKGYDQYKKDIQIDEEFIEYGMQLFILFYGNLWD